MLVKATRFNLSDHPHYLTKNSRKGVSVLVNNKCTSLGATILASIFDKSFKLPQKKSMSLKYHVQPLVVQNNHVNDAQPCISEEKFHTFWIDKLLTSEQSKV